MIWLLPLACPKPAPPAVAEPAELSTRRLHHRARNAYVLAHMAHAQGDLNAAAKHYERALVFDPGSAVLVQELGQVRVAQGQLESGQALLERSLELGAGPSARAALCQVQVQRGVAVSALHGWAPQGWRWAGCSHAAGGPLEPVLAALELSLSAQPTSSALWDVALHVVHTEQRYATGLAWMETALTQRPWHAPSLWRKVELAQGGSTWQALRVRDAGALISALTQLDALGEPALELLAQQHAHQSGHAGLLPRLQEPALSWQLLALGQEAAACAQPQEELSCGLTARCLVSKGEHTLAAEQVLRCESMDIEVRRELALAWDPQGFRALRVGSPASSAVLIFGALAALDAAEPRGALAMAQGLPASHPYRPGLEGLCRLALGQDALELLILGHERQPGDVALMAGLGRAHYQVGELAQAKTWLTRAARSGDTQAAAWLAELEAP